MRAREKARVSAAFGAVVAAGLWWRRRKNVRFGPVSGRSARRRRRNRSAGVARNGGFCLARFLSIRPRLGSAAWFLAVRFWGRRPAVTGGVFDTPPVSLWTFAGGTEGSNPSPSSGATVANLASFPWRRHSRTGLPREERGTFNGGLGVDPLSQVEGETCRPILSPNPPGSERPRGGRPRPASRRSSPAATRLAGEGGVSSEPATAAKPLLL